MSKCFNMKYENIICTLVKDNVQFFDGYGIVLAKVDIGTDVLMPAVGVVNSNFEEVIPLTLAQLMPDLEIVPNDTFLYQYYDVKTDKYFVWHSNANGFAVNLDANDFFGVDKRIYIMQFGDGDALYDAFEFKFITPKYTLISPFVDSEVHKQKVAKVLYIIRDENGEVIDEVDTVISTSGEVLEPFVSLKTREKIYLQSLDEVVNEIIGRGR